MTGFCHKRSVSLGQYLVPAKLNAFNSGLQVDKLYETYKTELSEKRDFDNEILRWQTKWSHSTDKKTSDTHRDSLQHANPNLYPNMVTIFTILVTMPVSTATPERSFSTMRRVKTYLRSTMKVERLAALALMHTYREIPIYWCRSRDSRILCQKEQTSSFRISLSSTKISDMFATNVSR